MASTTGGMSLGSSFLRSTDSMFFSSALRLAGRMTDVFPYPPRLRFEACVKAPS
jgi:hypothetical protein